MDIGYTVTTDGTWYAYVTSAEKIKGVGKDKCEALNDLIEKYRAIISTVQQLQSGKDCK